MFSTMIDFSSVLFAALTVGSMFAVWLIFNPAGLDASFYIALHQQGVRALNKTMPALGAITILLTIAATALGRVNGTRFRLLMVAVVCFAAAGLITRFLNQPINAIVMTWRADSPPDNWAGLRDKWWRWHLIRLASGLVGLSLLIVGTLRR
jgi:uncharacterized membrane protein